MNDLDHKVTLVYSGPYWDHEGEEQQAENLSLAYTDEEHEDRSAGILGNYVFACPTGKPDVDENSVSVDFQDWCEAACEQSGGHNFVPWSWGEEPESACQICTRCGGEENAD